MHAFAAFVTIYLRQGIQLTKTKASYQELLRLTFIFKTPLVFFLGKNDTVGGLRIPGFHFPRQLNDLPRACKTALPSITQLTCQVRQEEQAFI